MAVVKLRGKPENFTREQVEVLRRGLNQWIATENAERAKANRKALTQAEIGEALGITQQTVGKLLSSPSGMSYQTATRLARLCRFAGVDELFASELGDRWLDEQKGIDVVQRSAIRHALHLEISLEAIEAVNKKLSGTHFQKARMWVDRYSAMQDAIDAARLEAVPKSRRLDEEEAKPARRAKAAR
jgi:transcriptional regulator with XRE-family HTH domain